MPSRGVQDYNDYRQKKKEARQKDQDKLVKWCSLAGLTILELVLCLTCLVLSYMTIITLHWGINIKYLMLPKVPTIVSSCYFFITLVDLLSWFSLRPITYFAWLSVSTSGFLMFAVYAGISLFNVRTLIGILGIVFGCITALVFLVDTICCLLSLKRFPIPYWVLKRKYDKIDECVCTGDRDPDEEKEVERPLCRCGDNWGEPCNCDDSTCGCGANHKDEPPCPCCECVQALVQEQDGTTVYGSEYDYSPQKTVVTTAAGRDYLIEEDPVDPTKSTMTQVTLLPTTQAEVWCTDPAPSAPYPAYEVESMCSHSTRKSMGRPRSVSAVAPSSSHFFSRASTVPRNIDPDRKSTVSRRTEPRKSMAYSVYTSKVHHVVPSEIFEVKKPPSSKLKVKGLAWEAKHNYLDGDNVRVRNEHLSGEAPSFFSTDDEFGVGDYSRSAPVSNRDKLSKKRAATKKTMKYSTYTSTSPLPSHRLPKIIERNIPGQALSRNVSTTAKISGKRAVSQPSSRLGGTSTEEGLRPRSETIDRTIIRNVSTTVRPVRTLSSVLETAHESVPQSHTNVASKADPFPSECTITINK